MTDIIIKTEDFVFNLFKEALPNTFLYHNFTHTQRVLRSVKEIVENSDISAEDAGFVIYPNPTNDILHIKLSSFTNGAWQLYNTLGQIVTEGRFKEKDFSVAADRFTTGLYILKVQDLDRDLSYTEKIIVSKKL